MKIDLIVVPFDSGIRDARMGLGPGRLLDAGLADHLENCGHRVAVLPIDLPVQPLAPEPLVASEIWRSVADRVRAARGRGALPVVLSGSCYASLGAVAGVGPGHGVFWFDSHADFNTPETTTSGFLDGMAVAVMTGRCWRALTRRVPGFTPVPDRDLCFVGVRDVDPAEAEAIDRSEITLVPPGHVAGRLPGVLAALRGRVTGAYLHLDLDVLDPAEARANQLAAPGGIAVETVLNAISTIGAAMPIAGLALTAYDPGCDPERKVCRAAVAMLDAVVGRRRATSNDRGR